MWLSWPHVGLELGGVFFYKKNERQQSGPGNWFGLDICMNFIII